MFGHDARRKRAEILPVLDLLIEDIAHVRPARVGEQRTVAERAGPELHAPLKPGDDLAIGDHLRSLARGGLAARATRPADLTAARMSRRLNAGPRYGVELPRWGGFLCFAQCTTRRRRSRCRHRAARRDEHFGEITGLLDQFIGHAIERDPAGNAQFV
jgi:hypothetical protein